MCDGEYSAPAGGDDTCGAPEEACQGHIDWAMNTGIYTNPEWYPNLTADCSFEAFQCELALSVNVPDCNMAPCDFACDGPGKRQSHQLAARARRGRIVAEIA